LFAGDTVVATPGFRKSASPGYSSANLCPERCSISGPNTGNWSVYPDFKKIKRCRETVFYDFSLYDEVDSTTSNHRIQACSSFGPDFSTIPASTMQIAATELRNVEFQIGWWNEGFGLAASGIRSLVKQLRKYADHGHGATEKPFIIYGQSGQATIGLFIGPGLLNQGVSEFALKLFEDNLERLNLSTPTLAMELCGPDYDSSHTFGLMVTSNGTFSPIQRAVRSWTKGRCLSFSGSTKFAGNVKFTSPLPDTNRTIATNNSTFQARSSHSRLSHGNSFHSRSLHPRAECRTIQVEEHDLCPGLATRCGISIADFNKYNPGGEAFCNNLKVKQHVCCSSGDLPDLRPKPNEDGSCHAYQAQGDDNCDSLAAEYGLTRDELEDFNKNTWGWNGCHPLYKDTVMCLSKGTPPFPAPIANAVCGPQKPGSKPPTDGSDIAKLNPCPLNACCNIWGQCGITRDFCIDTNTGPPGTAAPNTYGCISNCGLDVVKGSGTGAIKIGYYEGFCLSRKCLYQDALQIDTSKYTHIHFGFGTLTPDYQVEVGDVLSTYQFGEFKKITRAKRILSFGGWEFSNSDATYKIFRTGVRPENRVVMATNIANFIKEHDLDGVDIDWEYPGAPDLPEYDPGTAEEGPNYFAFLVVLKNLLPGRSVSIAAPSSYWYLKQFPIKRMSAILDYIVYMTYDLHGQWDAHNSNSQEGCETGNCLRSQVNLTETKQSLAMITKAGVPGEKVIAGVTSYGRSFKMADPGCWGPNCQFTGDRLNSNAKQGKCTGTGGYLADAEIAEIMADTSRVVKSFVDTTSNSDILVYDNDEWVGYMSAATKRARNTLYSAWGLGGTSDWATDLQEYHPAPKPSEDWAVFIQRAASGINPKVDYTRNGRWTDFNCSHDVIKGKWGYPPSRRWQAVKADEAWEDIVRIWKETDRGNNVPTIVDSLSGTLQLGDQAHCGTGISDSCRTLGCIDHDDERAKLTGPAGQLIWNSIVEIHMAFRNYHDKLLEAAITLSLSMNDLQNKFAPLPEKDEDVWKDLLLDLLTLGGIGTAGPVFSKLLSQHAWFRQADSRVEDTTIVAQTLLGQGISTVRELSGGDDPRWTPEKQDEFSAYMGQVINAWLDINSIALETLLTGKEQEQIDAIWELISDGKLIEGSSDKPAPDIKNLEIELRNNILKCVFGFTIPALWRAASTHAFIIDTESDCASDNDHYLEDMEQYLDRNTMKTSGECIDGRQFYLVYPDGDAKECECVHKPTGGACEWYCQDNTFSSPPGLDTLNGTNFGNITKSDLVLGSVNTWKDNGKQNTDKYPDATNAEAVRRLMNVDITMPGFMQIPVCSAEHAFKSWDSSKPESSAFYPCDIPENQNHCGLSTFEDQTSEASPWVDDCRTIIRNIEWDGNTQWTTLVGGKPHREIAHHGSCHFGVEATTVSGNADFQVGGEDVISIIRDAIANIAKDSKQIGARGYMNCNGNIKAQPVLWGIY
jgi:GH18 family chitinase